MTDDAQISWEEYIPTDRYAIQDMYLLRLDKMSMLYEKIMRAQYQKASDSRALVEFFSLCNAFYWFARENIRKHLNEKEMAKMESLFEGSSIKPIGPQMNGDAMIVYQLMQRFAYKSQLTDLTSKRWKGEFANARKRIGIGGAEPRRSE